jgi:type 1 fimbria pilin
MMKRLGLGLVFGAALASAAWAQGTSQFDGQYVGEMTLTGIINGNCTTPPVGAEYPLTIVGGQVHFKYVPRFDTELTGRIDPNGSFKAFGQTKSGVVTMTGHVSGYHNLTANIVSPSCEYSYQSKN